LQKALIFAAMAPAVWAQSFTISTIAGVSRDTSSIPALSTPFGFISSMTLDQSGNLYFVEIPTFRVRRVSPAGLVSTVAGNGSGEGIFENVPATAAGITPQSVAVDQAGNVYFTEPYQQRVRRVSPSGLLTTFAGQQVPTGAPTRSGDGLPANQAQLQLPEAIAVDNAGNVYFSDYDEIRRVGTNGIIETVVGNGSGDQPVLSGPGKQIRISVSTSMITDTAGNLYFVDGAPGLVRKLDTSGFVTTVAGSLTPPTYLPPSGQVPATTQGMIPVSVALDGPNLYITASDNTGALVYLYQVSLSTGLIELVMGGPRQDSGDGGPVAQARFANGDALAAGSNTIYISDLVDPSVGHIRAIQNGMISNYLGGPLPNNVPAIDAPVLGPTSIASDADGDLIFIAAYAHAVQRILSNGVIQTVGPEIFPYSVTADPAGNIFVLTAGYQIYESSPSGNWTLIAGTGMGNYAGDNGPALQATFENPTAIAVDGADNVYVLDLGTSGSYVRKISAKTGIIARFAGNGTANYLGDDVPAIANGLSACSLVVDANQNLYIGDLSAVLMLRPDGTYKTIAGDFANTGPFVDGIPATQARIRPPCALAVDFKGDVYMADNVANTIRRVDATTGIINTIAGNGTAYPASGDGGPAKQAQFNPTGLVVAGPFGTLFISDVQNEQIRALQPPGGPAGISTLTSPPGTAGVGDQFPISVRIKNPDGSAAVGVPVTFAAVPVGAVTFQPVTVDSGSDGSASTNATIQTAGSVTVIATVEGLPAITFPIAIADLPVISAGGIVGAAFSSPPVRALSPNGLITIFGQNLAAPGTSKQVMQGDLIDGELPFVAGGVCVLVGGQYAYMTYASPTQVNVQAPGLPDAATVGVQVIKNCTTANQVNSNAQSIAVQVAAPEFFYVATNPGAGTNVVAAFEALGGTAISAQSPAHAGDVLTLYGTGFGLTNPAIGPGVIPVYAATLANPVTVRIGGVQLPTADVLYAGASGFAGVYQLNIMVPTGIPPGEESIVIAVAGTASPSSAVIAIGQ
jgi:uncharacterized protein (TIGR03437 family)